VLPLRPEATHVRVVVRARKDGAPVLLDAWSAATGTLRLPATWGDAIVEAVDVYVLDLDPFAVGNGSVDVERVARKAARAPGG